MKRIAALVPIVASSAFAQCVMCFRTAAAQNAERARVMNLGIIIMLIPPVQIRLHAAVLETAERLRAEQRLRKQNHSPQI